MSASHPLDGDGVNHMLFHYLSKDATTMLAKRKGNHTGEQDGEEECADESASNASPGATSRGRSRKRRRRKPGSGGGRDDSPDFQIPDTVVFFNTPTTWYYWDHTAQKCEKKDAKALEKENLEHFFGQPAARDCDICCTFLVRNTGDADSVLFLNKHELHDFLYSRPEHHGLLQRFVVPPGDYNYMYQAVWCRRASMPGSGSAKVFKRVSRQKLKDRHSQPTEKRANPAKEGYLCFAPLAKYSSKKQKKFDASIEQSRDLLLSPGTKLTQKEDCRKKELLGRILCVTETKTLNGEINKAARLCKELKSDFETTSQHYEKAITFEGASHYAEEKWCHNGIQKRIEGVCQSIVDHLEAIDHTYSIARMVAYFKEDATGRLWLMFSSAMRVQEARPHKSPQPQPHHAQNHDIYRFTGALTPNFKGVFSPEEEEPPSRPASACASSKAASPSLFSTKVAAMTLRKRHASFREQSNATAEPEVSDEMSLFGGTAGLQPSRNLGSRPESPVCQSPRGFRDGGEMSNEVVVAPRCKRNSVRPYNTPGVAHLSSSTSPESVPLYAQTLTTLQKMARKNELLTHSLKKNELLSQTSSFEVKREIERFKASNATLKVQVRRRQEEVKVLGGVYALQQADTLPAGFDLDNIFANEGHLQKGQILHMPLKEVHERRFRRRRKAAAKSASSAAALLFAAVASVGVRADKKSNRASPGHLFSAFKKATTIGQASSQSMRIPNPNKIQKLVPAGATLEQDSIVYDMLTRSYDMQEPLRNVGGRLFTFTALQQHYTRIGKRGIIDAWKNAPCEAPPAKELAVAWQPVDVLDDIMYTVYNDVAVLQHPVLSSNPNPAVQTQAAKNSRSAFVVEELTKYFPKDHMFDIPPHVAKILIPRFEESLRAMKIYPLVPEVEFERVVDYLSDRIPRDARCPNVRASDIEALEETLAEAKSRLAGMKRTPCPPYQGVHPLTCIIHHNKRGTMPEFNKLLEAVRRFIEEPIIVTQKRMTKGLKTHITLSRGLRKDLRQFEK